MTALLSMENITGGYGDADILKDVSMHVDPDEIVVIVGPNGAGKSTAMKSVFGMLTIRGGKMLFDGDDITKWTPNRIVQRGICYVPQVDNIFREMSIHENLEMGGFLKKGDLSAAYDRSTQLFPDLKERRKTMAGSLSGGQRQMVAMGRALMLDPKLLASGRADRRPVSEIHGTDLPDLPGRARHGGRHSAGGATCQTGPGIFRPGLRSGRRPEPSRRHRRRAAGRP